MHRLIQLFALNKGRGEFKALKSASGDGETFYLYDAIAGSDAEAAFFGGIAPLEFSRAIRESSAANITVRINSPGGSVFGGQVIAQAIRDHKSRVTVIVDGLAASAASVVAIAGDDVKVAKGAFVMIHRAWSISMGNAQDMLETAALLEKIDGSLADQYTARTGIARDDVLAMMDAETWMTADEAVEKCFADSLVESEAKASSKWDLSAYSNAPAIKDEEPEKEPAAPVVDRARLSRMVEAKIVSYPGCTPAAGFSGGVQA